MYFFAIDTTNLRFAAASFFLDSWSHALIFFPNEISSSLVNSSTLQISFRYILIESSLISESEIELFASFQFLFALNKFSLSSESIISTLSSKNLLNTSSRRSRSSSAFGIAFMSSS